MKNLNLIAILLFSLCISSCTRYYYKPNGVNVPLLTKAGDVHLNVAASVNNETDGTGANNNNMSIIDVQASGSPLNHLGVIVNYTSYNYTTTTPDYFSGNVSAKANLAEAGVGGYFALGGEKIKMVVDLYAGGGIGSIQSDISTDVTRLFIQPGIGMRSPWFDVAFSPRIVNLSYSNFSDNGRGNAYLESQGLIDFGGSRIDQRSYMFFEPTITMRGGYKFAKVQLQYVLSTPMSAMAWHSSLGRFSFGFYFTLEDMISTIRNANGRN